LSTTWSIFYLFGRIFAVSVDKADSVCPVPLTTSPADELLVEVITGDDGVAVVLINAPEARNALSRSVQRQLLDAFDKVEANDQVRAVVLRGAGDKVFAAGADLKQLKDYTFHDGLDGRLQSALTRIENCIKPTIAAVNGWALGGGCELALACDIRIAAESAQLGFPETGLGVIPGAGGTQRLARVVGAGRAMELILTGRIVDAAQAHSYGLVTEVVPQGELGARAREIAATIAARGPVASRLAKLAVRTALDTDMRTGLTIERLAQSLLHTTTDKQEGVSAFLAKRTPHFEGS
jgi:enoyl-CoA hydratase/carnithine racemase